MPAPCMSLNHLLYTGFALLLNNETKRNPRVIPGELTLA